MFRIAQLAATVVLVAMLGACASSTTRMGGAAASQTVAVAKSAKAVTLWLNDDAKKLVSDNIKFSGDSLRSTVERTLSSQGLIQTDATQTLDIEVTSFRVRSSFSAVMFGFMAGNDNIEGIVTVKDQAGTVLQKSKVTASYALGGLAGGQDESRMNWLYEEFAKHAAAELTGARVN